MNGTAAAKVDWIFRHGPSIYFDPEPENSNLYLSNDELQYVLLERLVGESLHGLPLRTRSKVAKILVCHALGYNAPATFRKTRPRFPHQNFDLYVQKADNLQIWNEEVDPERRYVVLRLNQDDMISAVRVLSGQELALLDSTGTLTSKYQASRRDEGGSRLVNGTDTLQFKSALQPVLDLPTDLKFKLSPVAPPETNSVLGIDSLYKKLLRLENQLVTDPGAVQDRLRGVELQKLVCEVLELGEYADGGQYPDVLCQALEVKLQLSRTIDLGLVSPDSRSQLTSVNTDIRHCDVRYAIVYASRAGLDELRINSVVVASGLHFFEEFRRFEGEVQNRKLQLRLPTDFFEVARVQRRSEEGIG